MDDNNLIPLTESEEIELKKLKSQISPAVFSILISLIFMISAFVTYEDIYMTIALIFFGIGVLMGILFVISGKNKRHDELRLRKSQAKEKELNDNEKKILDEFKITPDKRFGLVGNKSLIIDYENNKIALLVYESDFQYHEMLQYKQLLGVDRMVSFEDIIECELEIDNEIVPLISPGSRLELLKITDTDVYLREFISRD